MSVGVEFARRLELVDAVESDEGLCGKLGARSVRLRECDGTYELALTTSLPIEVLRLRTTASNDVDEVLTGDAAFDDSVQLLAQPGRGAQCAALFEQAELRTKVATALRSSTSTELRAGVLFVSGVSHTELPSTLRHFASLAEALERRWLESDARWRELETPPTIKVRWWFQDPSTLRRVVVYAVLTVAVLALVAYLLLVLFSLKVITVLRLFLVLVALYPVARWVHARLGRVREG